MKRKQNPLAKVCAAIMAVVLFACAIPVSAIENNPLEFRKYAGYEESLKGTYVVHRCNPNATGIITVPSEYNGEPVSTIAASAFENCCKLEKVVLEPNIKLIQENAFACCNSLKEIVLPEGLKQIEAGAFSETYSLKTLALPATLEITYNSFCKMYGLESFSVPEASPYYCTIDGVLFTKDCQWIVSYPGGKTADTYEIRSDVVGIERGAFDCQYLRTLTLPETVSYLDSEAFTGCVNLSDITLLNNDVEFFEDTFAHSTKLHCQKFSKTHFTAVTNGYRVKSFLGPDFFRNFWITLVTLSPINMIIYVIIYGI